ncbi:SH3 domain-containing protein [Caldilinea sp.]|uniref:SH3 domain-containing protein n=1 Tax=Caldilinea sp. TaxID=2293560 RepID=UPI002633CD98|nr:SH3 domain-containing protein [Caldilinea sp.]
MTSSPTAPPTVPVVVNNANLRAGPGTNYPIVGGMSAHQTVTVIGRNSTGDWLQLDDGAWIAAFLVSNAPPNLPIVNVASVNVASTDNAQSRQSDNAFTCIGGCATPPDPSCAIKGNVNSRGEKIYHMPGWRDYDRTDIKPEEGDVWFCTAAEAEAAGFRAPRNH